MAISSPKTGYTPGIHMPMIGPPPAGTNPQTHYSAIMVNATMTVTPVAGTRLTIAVSNTAASQLFAVTGGPVTFIPAGARLPDAGATLSPGAGSLILNCWVNDVQHLKKILPSGVPPMLKVLYLNVDPTTVKTALAPLINVEKQVVLEIGWDRPFSAPSLADLQTRYLERLLLGQMAIFVNPGTQLGEAALVNPANPASNREFTLLFTASDGNDLSPLLHLRGMDVFGGPQWAGHPLAAALKSTPVPISIHLQFEIWNKGTKTFEPLPAGLPVDVMDYDPISPNEVLDTQNTDGQGQVQFSFANPEALAGEQPDIFFRVRPNGIIHAGHTLPDEWSTKGWKALDGSPGYYENFAGTQLGDALQPLVFRIGLDFHVRLQYKNARTGLIEPAPKGVSVGIHNKSPGDDPSPKILARTNDEGEVHDVLFEIAGEDTVYFHVPFEIEDKSINLPQARVVMDEAGWSTFLNDADKTPKTYYPNLDFTSIGTQTVPASLLCTVNDRNVALYFLKILRELSIFLFHMTGGAWNGVSNLKIFPDILWPAEVPYSWPVKTVRLNRPYHWDRGTIIHELSHQVVWKQANYSTEGIGFEFLVGEMKWWHWENLLSNPEASIIEGWPEIIQAIFDSSSIPPYGVGSITDKSQGNVLGGLGPPPFNRGESVEGAFANGIWTIFRDHVVTNAWSSSNVPESLNGDITTTAASWLTDTNVRARFLSMIWQPLGDLSSMLNPTTTAYINNIRIRNPVDWPVLQAKLKTFNMAF